MPQLLSGPFYFLRHGESETNRRRVIAGSQDPALTERGREQADAAARLVSTLPIAALYASPKRRAADTARVAATALNLPVHWVDDLRERHWGELEGRPTAERKTHFMTPRGGEGWESFVDRVWSALTAIDGPAPGMIVAHAGIMLVLQHKLGIGADFKLVDNARPVRFDPPPQPDQAWRMTVVGDAGESAWTTLSNW